MAVGRTSSRSTPLDLLRSLVLAVLLLGAIPVAGSVPTPFQGSVGRLVTLSADVTAWCQDKPLDSDCRWARLNLTSGAVFVLRIQRLLREHPGADLSVPTSDLNRLADLIEARFTKEL